MVEHTVVGKIGPGLLVFIGVQSDDADELVARMAQRLLNYRLFSDTEGKMNLSVLDSGGSILLVSQFTLTPDKGRGNRLSFSKAAPPALRSTATRRWPKRSLRVVRRLQPDNLAQTCRCLSSMMGL